MGWASKTWKKATKAVSGGVKSLKKDFRINKHSFGRDVRHAGISAVRWFTLYEMGSLTGGEYPEAKATSASGTSVAGRSYRKQKLAIEEMKKINRQKATEWEKQLEEEKRARLEQRKTQINVLRERVGVGTSTSPRSQRVTNTKARRQTLG